MRRRDLLRGALAAGVTASVTGRGRRALAGKAAVLAPRGHRVVTIILNGGFDSLMTVDPKDASKLREKIDPCYRYDECVKVGDRLFGPLIAPLGRYAADLGVMNGVRLNTVAHPRGWSSLWTGRTLPIFGVESFWTTLAKQLSGEADIPVLMAPAMWNPNFSAGTPDKVPEWRAFSDNPGADFGMFAGLDPTTLDAYKAAQYSRPGWFDAMDARQRNVMSKTGLLNPDEVANREREDKVQRAVHRLLTMPSKLDAFGSDVHALPLRVIYDGLCLGTAKSYSLLGPEAYLDSHHDHVATQTKRLLPFFEAFKKFLDALSDTPVEGGGTLLGQTTIVVVTEIGRWPTLNGNGGKDHWPEASFFMLGKGVRPGVVGSTGDDFRSLPIDHRSGSLTQGQPKPLFVDAMSATLLRIAGAKPSAHGFSDDDVLLPLVA